MSQDYFYMGNVQKHFDATNVKKSVSCRIFTKLNCLMHCIDIFKTLSSSGNFLMIINKPWQEIKNISVTKIWTFWGKSCCVLRFSSIFKQNRNRPPFLKCRFLKNTNPRVSTEFLKNFSTQWTSRYRLLALVVNGKQGCLQGAIKAL